MDAILFIIYHERVGFCLGMGTGLILSGIIVWASQFIEF